MEKIQNILFTCSFIENNYLAFESSVEAWQSLKWGDYSKPVVARRFCRLMKLNFDKVIDENAVRVTHKVLEIKNQGDLNRKQRRIFENCQYHWRTFLKKTVEIEELFPENKGCYVTYEDDDGTNLFD